jgi:hypothetical protein
MQVEIARADGIATNRRSLEALAPDEAATAAMPMPRQASAS